MTDIEATLREHYPDAADKLLLRIDEVEELTVRSINCCFNAGLEHVYDLLQYSPQDLLNARMSGNRRMFGPKTVREITAYMESIGAPLKPNPAGTPEA